ncbi:MAG: hypothetical protein NVV73_12295 [Cellvibrionaceae bacterium]|nr:hypothetical protein [Cellvibrionaceae bacterium]
MSNKTLHDLIMWTEEFHLGMSRSLQMGSVHAGERERLLLEYLIGHEQELAQLVNRYGENARATALNTWVSAYTEQYPPEKYSLPVLDIKGKDTAAIMADVQQQHDRVINIYRHLKDFVESSANELVSDLLQLETREMLRISQSANRLEDI